jgi:hypothetical protein
MSPPQWGRRGIVGWSRRCGRMTDAFRRSAAHGRVAGWLRDPRLSFQGVLAAGPRGVWVATTAPALLHMVTGWRLEKGRPADRATLNRRYGGHAHP